MTSTVYLSMTIQRNGQHYTLPLTTALFLAWLLSALPLMAAQTVNSLAYSILTMLSATVLTLIMTHIFIKALAWGVLKL